MKIHINALVPSSYTLALLAAGFMSAFAFAPWDIWPLLVVCVGTLFYILRMNHSPLKAAFYGLFFAWIFNLANLWWVTSAFIQHAPVPEVKAVAYPAVVLMCLILALPYAIMSVVFTLVQKTMPQRSLILALVFAVLWTGVELLRGTSIYGFPWNLLGYSLSSNLELLQLASITTVFGLSFIVALSAALMATLQPVLAGVAVALFAGLWGYGQQRLNAAPESPTQSQMFLVQTTIPQPEKWDEALKAYSIQKYLELSATAQPGDVIVWPETALTYDLTTNAMIREQLQQFLPYQAKLVTGHPRYTEDENRYYNAMTLLRPDGTLGESYDKHLLVPFGEFVPLRHYLTFLGELATSTFDYTAGTGKATFNLENGTTALPLICYEAIFPFFVKDHLADADLMLNITNDAWFSTTHAPLQHFALSRLRAIETGVPLVRLANSGISAVVDGYGRVTTLLDINESKGLRVAIPKPIPAGVDK